MTGNSGGDGEKISLKYLVRKIRMLNFDVPKAKSKFFEIMKYNQARLTISSKNNLLVIF